jgi:hypothetical protein
VNEYVTKFTQLSRYAPHDVDTDEKKHECFLNGLNDGRAYALEAQDFENFQGMVNKSLVLENHRGVMERKLSWCVMFSAFQGMVNKNLRASTGRSSEPLSVRIMFPKELSS